jgi:hypothetical protein
MKLSALALGASVLALALTAGPAAAEPGVGQTVDDSTGAAQVGAVSVDAPVRVASDGESTTAGTSAGGPQTTGESTGAAQVTSVDANAPVRVLSDGNDAEAAGSAGDTESTSDSTGSAQVGSPNAAAPVRVLSDGDNSTTEAGAGAGPQTVGDSSGSAQVGSPSLFAPVRVLSGGTGPGDESDAADAGDLAEELLGELLGTPSGGGGEVVATPSSLAPTSGDGPGSPSAEELARLLDGPDPDQAYMFSPNGTGGTATGEVATLGVAAAGTLPYTGFGLVAVALLGLWLCSGGLALRLVPGGKRR